MIEMQNTGRRFRQRFDLLKINGVRTSFASPWQNAVAERCVGSCGSELLDHVIVLNERHLKWLLSEYVSYYHEDRTHLGLEKGTPGRRTRCETFGSVLCHDRLGGLHHRYDRAANPKTENLILNIYMRVFCRPRSMAMAGAAHHNQFRSTLRTSIVYWCTRRSL
jgi:putative transposase